MGHRFISLGAACSPATILKRLGLRHSSFPFDWLWNLDSGMSAVCHMISDDFRQVCGSEAYAKTTHPRLGYETTAYRAHPSVLHVHSDPLANASAHADLVRRFDRFRDALRSDDTLHFVFYRSLTMSRGANPTLTPEEALRALLAEGVAFLDLVKRTAETHVLLVLEADVADAETTAAAAARLPIPDPRISLGTALSRYEWDKRLNRRWLWQWSWVVIRSGGMPRRLATWLAAKTLFRFARYAVKDAAGAIFDALVGRARRRETQAR